MSNKTPLILITGGAGYLGSVLVPHLLRLSYRVRVLDRFQHSYPSLLDLVEFEGFEPVRGDCRDKHTLVECLKGVDFIIPLAAIVGAPACDKNYWDANSINVDAIDILNSVRWNIPVLYPNTNSGYGKTPPGEICTEDTPLRPLSLYGITKQAAELRLMEHTSSAISFRLATAFGPSPRMRLDLLVNDFTHRAVRDGSVTLYEPKFRRNFIHVYDIARLFAFGIKNFDKLKGKVWNAGLHYSLTKEELCQTIQKYVPSFQYFSMDSHKDPDQRDYNVSTERLEKMGFKCGISLERGIRELIKAYSMFPIERFRNA